jgi:uncharacterized protein (DUF1697 family)
MALIVFLRGINVGGHRTFRPNMLARELGAYDVVNVGAAGTFVVRKPGSRAKFLAELRQKLPFRAEVAFCNGSDLVGLDRENPFGSEPSRPDTVRFMSILSKTVRGKLSLPIALPDSDEWFVRIIASKNQLIFGEYRRHMKTIGYLGQIDKLFGAPATTRSWSTIRSVLRVLKGNETDMRNWPAENTFCGREQPLNFLQNDSSPGRTKGAIVRSGSGVAPLLDGSPEEKAASLKQTIMNARSQAEFILAGVLMKKLLDGKETNGTFCLFENRSDGQRPARALHSFVYPKRVWRIRRGGRLFPEVRRTSAAAHSGGRRSDAGRRSTVRHHASSGLVRRSRRFTPLGAIHLLCSCHRGQMSRK